MSHSVATQRRVLVDQIRRLTEVGYVRGLTVCLFSVLAVDCHQSPSSQAT